MSEQTQINTRVWASGEHVGVYANRTLGPAEVMILVRYREAFAGRTIDVGCGAGRVLGYMVALGREVHGIDISPAMIDYCARAYPGAVVTVGDASRLETAVPGPFDAILAANCLIDVFDSAERREVLARWRALLAPQGLLIFSSHNLSALERPAAAADPAPAQHAQELISKVLHKPLADIFQALARLPRRLRNRRRLATLQERDADHAIVNDDVFDYSLLHYYIDHDAQAQRLAEAGYELLECLDPEGHVIAPGETNYGDWLHYIARPA